MSRPYKKTGKIVTLDVLISAFLDVGGKVGVTVNTCRGFLILSDIEQLVIVTQVEASGRI